MHKLLAFLLLSSAASGMEEMEDLMALAKAAKQHWLLNNKPAVGWVEPRKEDFEFGHYVFSFYDEEFEIPNIDGNWIVLEEGKTKRLILYFDGERVSFKACKDGIITVAITKGEEIKRYVLDAESENGFIYGRHATMTDYLEYFT